MPSQQTPVLLPGAFAALVENFRNDKLFKLFSIVTNSTSTNGETPIQQTWHL